MAVDPMDMVRGYEFLRDRIWLCKETLIDASVGILAASTIRMIEIFMFHKRG